MKSSNGIARACEAAHRDGSLGFAYKDRLTQVGNDEVGHSEDVACGRTVAL